MELIQFTNGHKYYEVSLHRVSPTIMKIVFKNELPEKEINKGFCLVNERNYRVMSSFKNYVTTYRTYEDDELTVELSNDGSVYIAPAPVLPKVHFDAGFGGTLEGETVLEATSYENLVVPTPVAHENYEFTGWMPEIPESGEIAADVRFSAQFVYVPTLEEVQEEKVKEMNNVQQMIIQNGVNVTLTDGSVEHFSLTSQDQDSLMGLQSMVSAGEKLIPWHNSNEAEHCKYYSNADMGLITSSALAFITYHVTYYRDLRIFIRSLTNKEIISAVFYGMNLPEEFQSEPLKNMLAATAVET